MWKQKLCLSTSGQFNATEEEQIRLFKQIGFDGFFCMYSEGKDLVKIREVADECGMYFQSIHAPFGLMVDIWKPSDKTKTAVSELIHCVQETARAGVPIVVMHAFIGFEDHTPTKEGIENLRPIIAEAEKLGVKIAFENTEGEEYLSAIMNEFRSENVGFCWDTGHEMCYNHSRDMMSVYGERIFCTHLNDNLGIKDYNGKITYIDDLHLLPFDGVANWNNIAYRLNKYGFDKELTFELNTKSKPGRHENDIYDKMDLTAYLTEAYKRACRSAAIKNNMDNFDKVLK